MNDDLKPDPRVRDLLGRFPGWECWVGVSGLLYARRRNTSPPVVVRAPTTEALADLITLTETHGGCWRFSFVAPERIQPRTPGGGFIARHRHLPGVECCAPTADILTQQIAALEAEA